jgi:hypothetical protein
MRSPIIKKKKKNHTWCYVPEDLQRETPYLFWPPLPTVWLWASSVGTPDTKATAQAAGWGDTQQDLHTQTVQLQHIARLRCCVKHLWSIIITREQYRLLFKRSPFYFYFYFLFDFILFYLILDYFTEHLIDFIYWTSVFAIVF